MIENAVITLPVEWVRPELYCQVTGETMRTIKERTLDGTWAAGKHFKRTSQRVLWINLKEAQRWVQNQQHVEAEPLRKASK